jgi:hypothetical protein
VIDLFVRARRGEFAARPSIDPPYWAMDVGLMKMAHVLGAIELCVTVPCLVQHVGADCAHTNKPTLYAPRNHQNRYFPGVMPAWGAVSTDVLPRAWQLG